MTQTNYNQALEILDQTEGWVEFISSLIDEEWGQMFSNLDTAARSCLDCDQDETALVIAKELSSLIEREKADWMVTEWVAKASERAAEGHHWIKHPDKVYQQLLTTDKLNWQAR